MSTEDADYLAMKYHPFPKGHTGGTPAALLGKTLVTRTADSLNASLSCVVPPSGGSTPLATATARPIGT